jgi:hypothetical protein
MRYMQAFLSQFPECSPGPSYKTYETPGEVPVEGDAKNAHTCPDHPTKPTKPSFVGFVGTSHQENGTCIPDRSVWRSEVATWDIPRRQRWADLAESHQDSGDPWNVAEWKAFQDVTA